VVSISDEQKIISVNIPKSMYDWLEQHSEINRSQLFRETIENKMKGKTQRVSSLMFLASVMGIVMSVVLVCIALVPSWIHIYIRGIMGILGGILAVTTTLLYYKEQKRVRQ
jgi:hypothetical protein